MEDTHNESAGKYVIDPNGKLFAKFVNSIFTVLFFISAIKLINIGSMWNGFAFLIGSAGSLNMFLFACNVYSLKVKRVIVGILMLLLVIVGFKMLA